MTPSFDPLHERAYLRPSDEPFANLFPPSVEPLPLFFPVVVLWIVPRVPFVAQYATNVFDH